MKVNILLAWFTPEGESLWSWLRDIQRIETLYDKLNNTNFPK